MKSEEMVSVRTVGDLPGLLDKWDPLEAAYRAGGGVLPESFHFVVREDVTGHGTSQVAEPTGFGSAKLAEAALVAERLNRDHQWRIFYVEMIAYMPEGSDFNCRLTDAQVTRLLALEVLGS